MGIGEPLPESRGGCAVCKIWLCCKGDCVQLFHASDNDMKSKEQISAVISRSYDVGGLVA